MEPLTLLALAAAAGFVFVKLTRTTTRNEEAQQDELTYSRDLVSRAKRCSDSDFDLSAIEVLPEYLLAKKLVESDFPLLFVTGGAGTGKSTFVKWLVHQFSGKVLLAAPTGIAAINIGGTTLHSLFKLPPAWITRADIRELRDQSVIKEAEVLLIEEISMVNANLLDGVSGRLRASRGIDKPFGGLPVIMIGDMFQLPPVVSSKTRPLFERIYGSAKFYNARSLLDTTYYAIELKKTYRQSDQAFVDLLVKIREGVDIGETISQLNINCTITDQPPRGAVWLSPRKAEVDRRNSAELEKLNGARREFHGTIIGRFKTDRLPSPLKLEIKPGAQVMFTKNDIEKRWVNGTVGIVERIYPNRIVVELINSNLIVEVQRVKWPDFEYRWNSSTCEIDREEVGSYTQYPLMLAWAMTIHKSQGRTIEKVHVDLGRGAFATGQTYVALSRCRSLEGLSMARPLKISDILVDAESKDFYDKLRTKIKQLPPASLMEKLGLLLDGALLDTDNG